MPLFSMYLAKLFKTKEKTLISFSVLERHECDMVTLIEITV